MNNPRKYGREPYTVIVLHGGPGASGEMAPVAKELSRNFGVLEVLQTSGSIEGQIQELHSIIEANAVPLVTLIGHSWGAWLGFIFTAQFSSRIRKLILIGSGPFEEKYASKIAVIRSKRLNREEKNKLQKLEESLKNLGRKDKEGAFRSFGKLIFKADSFDPLPAEEAVIEYQQDIFQSVWCEAEELRRSGKLLKFAHQIQCPVLAIHGDYDPHPFQGVKEPLTLRLKDFRFVLLEKCGHTPWHERHAKTKFYDILNAELRSFSNV